MLRIGRYLERQGLLERDAENSYLVGDGLEAGPLDQLLGSSITHRINIGPQQGCKVFTLPACDERNNFWFLVLFAAPILAVLFRVDCRYDL